VLLRRQEPSGSEVTKRGFVYIMSSRRNGTLYLGVTSDLIQPIYQHRNGLIDGFSKQYGCKFLVWYEMCEDLREARKRELQMKKWKRTWKLRAIEEKNPIGATCSMRFRFDWVPACAGTR